MGQAWAPHHPEDKIMPKCRIAPYQPPRPTLREVMERRAAGIPPKRYPKRPPKSAYRDVDCGPV